MHRRTLLRHAIASLAVASLPRRGWAAESIGSRTSAVASVSLPRLELSWDRVINTTVGLRPHRDSGFVVKAVTRGERLLVHDYGHGGAGMSLAWGTGALAADLALKQEARTAAVIGAGAVGLAAAQQLQARGFDVTVYAKELPPETTSNMSLAAFIPATGVPDAKHRTPAWVRQFREAALISADDFERRAGRDGVAWVDNYTASDDRPTDLADSVLPQRLRTERDRTVLTQGRHPFPTRYAVYTRRLSIDPSVYLQAQVREFLAAGGRLSRRDFPDVRALLAIPERVIVNCTGLGAAALFDDRELIPVKGQLTVFEPQPEIAYRAGLRIGRGPDAINISMSPRSDGIVLGNAQERGVWTLEPNREVEAVIVNAAIAFFGRMRSSPIPRS
jgi:D-amino-acid oxidase